MNDSEVSKSVKNTLLDFLPIAIEELKGIITSKKASDKVKLEAISTLFDRVGLPVLRASISRTVVGSPIDLPDIMDAMQQLDSAEKKLDSAIMEIEGKLGKADSAANTGVRGSSGKNG